MGNDVITIEGVRGYVDASGTVWLKLEDVAVGLEFTRVETKNGTEYFRVRWDRVSEYLDECGFAQKVGEKISDAFIPENVFYKLIWKSRSPKAKEFQNKVTDEILPAIRKHGAYMTPDTIKKVLMSPDFIIELATELKEEQARNAALTQAIKTLEPKASYCDIILNCPDTVTITVIAKDYGKSAVEFNKILASLGIQFKQGKTWVLYARYADKGYTQSKTHYVTSDTGRTKAFVNTEWTQLGRMFLYETLRKNDIYPTIETLNIKGD
ncbi:MAG: phage antirepressor KilAC domain-containing protein [Selenomonadaceae bacterium]|nr:phage antirepressor KilAC domain-containing protein [Selenomonadaceae bacterium]